jgi:hypothetical protein
MDEKPPPDIEATPPKKTEKSTLRKKAILNARNKPSTYRKSVQFEEATNVIETVTPLR